MAHKCIVCNYNGLYDEPYDTRMVASDEICPCCGFHYGFDDDGEKESIYESWRLKWLAEGSKWFSKSRRQPEGWDAKKQLEGLKL
ncbi:hypothetical protein [Anaeroarcus burkinensis]|uniref:hypothetical protein n=1 Tax=Anaeroarcus burkinensis TaxID=82376 RepID=UPI000484FDBD|nr:hypothetical protein [Anaeroarcus burkinensis]